MSFVLVGGFGHFIPLSWPNVKDIGNIDFSLGCEIVYIRSAPNRNFEVSSI